LSSSGKARAIAAVRWDVRRSLVLAGEAAALTSPTFMWRICRKSNSARAITQAESTLA
jgi:hypothetical protein